VGVARIILFTPNKVNGITPMNIDVQIAHPKLFTRKKKQINDKVTKATIHV
jgi:hypothetical protein